MYYLNMNESFISESEANDIYNENDIEEEEDEFFADVELFNRASEILKCN